MFKGYKLNKFSLRNPEYFDIGLSIFLKQNPIVEKALKNFLLKDQSLDAAKIMESWFPQIKANVFISHSHKDKHEVIALSGWLYKYFGIISFVDSLVWGHGDKLIKDLDDIYSIKGKSYDYEKSLLSASHVHMMLMTALQTMIDRTECLIFYNTPNSLNSFENKEKTESPWIYSEITFSEFVRIQKPERIKKLILDHRRYSDLGMIEKGMKIKYNINTKHLKNISSLELRDWKSFGNFKNPEEALDRLYELTFPNIESI